MAEEPVNTSVRVRIRPPSARESANRCLKCPSKDQLTFIGADGISQTSFTFDLVYGEGATQAQVFDDVKFVVDASLSGYNGTILAYGQTGSGKTHTLIGNVADPEQHGVIPRAVTYLAEGIANCKEQSKFQVLLSVVEIYCERICDLLGDRDNLQVKQDPLRGACIEGATELAVENEQQLVVFMQQGLAQRSVAATGMNETSSRSHCIVTVYVEKTCQDGSVQQGKLCMVDLAGSERQSKTRATGATLAEGSQINKSLSCLANVIYALTDEKAHHVPYRDSKLTRVLQDSLGGSAKTVLIMCCSPCTDNAEETLSTLRFGSRAKGVKNVVQVNERISAEKLFQQLEAARARNSKLEKELAQLNSSRVAPTQSIVAAKEQCLSSTLTTDLQHVVPHQSQPNMPSTTNALYAATAADTPVDPSMPRSNNQLGKRCMRHKQLLVDVLALMVSMASILVYMVWEDGYYRAACASR